MPLQSTLINSKLPSVGTTIFAKMSGLATEHKAINLSQGFPDFQSSQELIALVNKFMKKGYNQYSPLQGVLPLREVIKEKMEELYQAQYDPQTEITVTSGGTEAIYSAVTAVINRGDEVIILEPAYDCYAPAVMLNGGTPVYVKLNEGDYSVDWEGVRAALSEKTKLIMINSPHNPTGAVLSEADMISLQALVADTDILILSDEVYEHILFDGIKHQSMAAYPKLAERSFIVFSFGKTFHNTGWKLGYCLAPEELMIEFQKVHQFIVFSSNTPMQHALAEYMEDPTNYAGLGEFYQAKRDRFAKLLKDSPFEILPCKGTYFQLLGYNKFSEEADTELAIRLTREIGVASIPISVFYHDNLDQKVLRFCFAKSDETLEKAGITFTFEACSIIP